MLICFKKIVKTEFENSIKRFSFLCCLLYLLFVAATVSPLKGVSDSLPEVIY